MAIRYGNFELVFSKLCYSRTQRLSDECSATPVERLRRACPETSTIFHPYKYPPVRPPALPQLLAQCRHAVPAEYRKYRKCRRRNFAQAVRVDFQSSYAGGSLCFFSSAANRASNSTATSASVKWAIRVDRFAASGGVSEPAATA